jgi:hypothetical protein
VPKVVVSVAVPDVSVPVPIDVEPLKKVTIPVAAEGETVAVKTTLVPSTAVVGEAESETVLAVVPVEVDVPLGLCQKSPHPAKASAAANKVRTGSGLRQIGVHCIRRPHRVFEKTDERDFTLPFRITLRDSAAPALPRRWPRLFGGKSFP